ncbi:MAG: saccharopine dehydrogenase C-terminal domain-containing protein [Candidatus Heimdallarchaeota archaeon]
MKILVLGAGKMGYGLLTDISSQSDVSEVVAADADLQQAKSLAERIGSDKIEETRKVDVTNYPETIKLMREGFDVVASALPSQFCIAAAKAAIDAGVGYTDVASPFNTIFNLQAAAKAADVTVIPHIGLDIGIDRVLCGIGARKLDRVEQFHVWCGGFPQKGTRGYNNPLKYKISWHWPTAALSNLGVSRVLKDGEIVEIPKLSDPEEITFSEPLGSCETYTTGSCLDVIEHLGLKDVKDAWCKTVRWKGHCEIWRKLIDLNLLDDDPLLVKGVAISPREVFLALGEKTLQYDPEEADVVCQRVKVSGLKDSVSVSFIYEFLDFYDSEKNLSAMARTTAFPCSIVAQMIAKDEIKEKGVIHPAKIGWSKDLSEKFLQELRRRGIDIVEQFIPHFD